MEFALMTVMLFMFGSIYSVKEEKTLLGVRSYFLPLMFLAIFAILETWNKLEFPWLSLIFAPIVLAGTAFAEKARDQK